MKSLIDLRGYVNITYGRPGPHSHRGTLRKNKKMSLGKVYVSHVYYVVVVVLTNSVSIGSTTQHHEARTDA